MTYNWKLLQVILNSALMLTCPRPIAPCNSNFDPGFPHSLKMFICLYFRIPWNLIKRKSYFKVEKLWDLLNIKNFCNELENIWWLGTLAMSISCHSYLAYIILSLYGPVNVIKIFFLWCSFWKMLTSRRTYISTFGLCIACHQSFRNWGYDPLFWNLL